MAFVQNLQFYIRLQNLFLLSGILFLISTGYKYCSPKCPVSCLDLWVLDWPSEVRLQYVTFGLIGLTFALDFVLCFLPCCRFVLRKRFPLMMLSLCFLCLLGVVGLEFYHGTCPWDGVWKDNLEVMKQENRKKYNRVLEDLMDLHGLEERELFCIMYAPCYVYGWLAASGLALMCACCFLVDLCVTAKFGSNSCRHDFGVFYLPHCDNDEDSVNFVNPLEDCNGEPNRWVGAFVGKMQALEE